MKKQKWLQDKYWSEIEISGCLLKACIVAGLIILADVNDIPSKWIEKYGMQNIGIVLASIIGIGLIISWRDHCWNLFRIPVVNEIDCLMLTGTFVGIVTFVGEEIVCGMLEYKAIVLGIGMLICFVISMLRYICCWRQRKKHTEKNNVVDLKDFLDGVVQQKKGILLFSEVGVDYDLLGRKALVDQLYGSIKESHFKNVYVIGVKGSWGSGKTTLINIVKERIYREDAENISIIDDFDPWMFGSQGALLTAMYDVILKEAGIRVGSYNSRVTLKKMQDVITSNHEIAGIVHSIIGENESEYDAVKKVKKKLENYLEQLDKTIVFIIDNIERADAENVLFLFKMIGAVFNLPNIIYVLSYDEKRLTQIFDDTYKINPRYLEKIIQQEIYVPEVQHEKLNWVYRESIKKLLIYYGEEERLYEYAAIIDIICKKARNLRTFKRLVNSVFVTTFSHNNNLYKPNLLAIEMIRFMEPDLYEKIWRNKDLFIGYDIDITMISEREKKENEEKQAFFDDLANEYDEYREILIGMFPKIKQYIHPPYFWGNIDGKELQRNISISAPEYFEAYFSYGTNYFLEIVSDVKKYILDVNGCVSEGEIRNITSKYLTGLNAADKKVWFEKLGDNITGIFYDNKVELAKGLWDSLEKKELLESGSMNSPGWKAIITITKLLNGIENTLLGEAIEQLSRYYNVELLEKLIRNCRYEEKQNETQITTFKELCQEKYNSLCKEVLEHKIDIYQGEVYRRKQIWSLYQFCEENKYDIKKYILQVISTSNICKILADIIDDSIDDRKGEKKKVYRIQKEYIEELAGSNVAIQRVAEKVIPENNIEKVILEVWNRYMNGETDEWGRNNYYYSEIIELKL